MEAMENMGGIISIISIALILLGSILGILWLIIPFVLIKKLNNIDDAVRTFHTDLAQFLNDYSARTLHR